jgi:hypothetical protein
LPCSTFKELAASGVELDEPPQALSSRAAAVRADKDRVMRRTWLSRGGRGPGVRTSVRDEAGDFTKGTPWL